MPAPRDRRGEGLAGVAGDLLTSGATVLVVVADVPRRRAGLERLAGMAPGGLAVAAWLAIAADPGLTAPYEHVLALDPPPTAAGVGLLEAGGALVHLGWGEPERAFALAHWRAQLAIRPALVEVWRALAGNGAGPSGEELAALLRGAGTYPREGALSARLVIVLSELGLVRYEPQARTLVALDAGRTDLQRSSAARAYAVRLAEVEGHLTESAPRSRPVAHAG